MNSQVAGRRELGLGLLVAVPAFAVYAFTACRDIAWVDSVEFALAGAVFGIPHPTGYPLHILFLRLLGAGGLEPAWGANLFSGLAAAVACGGCVVLGLRIGLRPAAALAGALSLAFCSEVLAQATVAEVYSLHLLIVTLLLAAGLALAGEPERLRDPRRLLLLGYLIGLGLAHHLTTVLAIPALLILCAGGWRRIPSAGIRNIAATAALILLPLTLYAVLPMRSLADPVLDLGDPETPARLITHMTGRQFGYRLLTSDGSYVQEELGRFFSQLPRQWTYAHLPVAALGMVALIARPPRRRFALALLVLALAVIAHAVEYHIPDKSGYFLPAYLAIALFVAAGAQVLMAVIPRRPWGAVLIWAFALGLPLATAIARVPAADRHADRSLRDLTFEIVRRTTPGSLIVSDDTNVFFAFLYLQEVEGVFRDREIVSQYLLPLPWYAERLAGTDPALKAEVEARAEMRLELRGRALGDRTAQDARQLAAGLVRRARAPRGTGHGPGRDVFLFFNSYEKDLKSFEDLSLTDCGLVYQVTEGDLDAPPAIPDATLARRAAYEFSSTHRQTRSERMVARRFAAAANRAGIARVARGDLEGAEMDFKQALALNPGYPQAWLNLGILAADYFGRPHDAVQAWRHYLELAPGAPDAGAVAARVAELAKVEGGP